VVGVRRQKHVLREIDLDAVALPNRNGGGIWRKRSRMLVADCETLAAVPFVNACEPLVVMVPPPCVISPAPAITPKAIEVPKISR